MSTKANIMMEQGATFSIDINLLDSAGEPLDVTGFTAKSEMRKHYLSANGIMLDTELTHGSLKLTLPAANTIPIEAGRYVYDVELTNSDGIVSRPLEGIVTVKAGVTLS